MSAPLPTKDEVVADVRRLLARALGRIVQDEAAGRLSPEHAAILGRLRAKHADELGELREAR